MVIRVGGGAMIWCQKSSHFLLFQLLNVIRNVSLVQCGIEPQANRTTANPVGVLFQLVCTTLIYLKIRLKITFGPTPQDKLLSSNASVFAYDILLRVSRNQAHELDIREGLRVSTAFQNGADATKNVIGFDEVLVPHINDANIARVLVQDLHQHAIFPIVNFIRLLLLELGHHYHLLASDGDMQCLLFLVL